MEVNQLSAAGTFQVEAVGLILHFLHNPSNLKIVFNFIKERILVKAFSKKP